MNERIVKLITEADAYAWGQYEKYVPECGEANYLWEDAFRKKFAELIVRECAYVCRAKYAESDPMSIRTSNNFANDIKKHFGVE